MGCVNKALKTSSSDDKTIYLSLWDIGGFWVSRKSYLPIGEDFPAFCRTKCRQAFGDLTGAEVLRQFKKLVQFALGHVARDYAVHSKKWKIVQA